MKPSTNAMYIPALEVRQGPNRLLYSFAIDGKLVPNFATITRIRRTNENEIVGYQRPEALAHISGIRDYIESESPMIPNAIVLAFNSSVQFIPDPDQTPDASYIRKGTLVIPHDGTLSDQEKPGFVVDGQQRLAAIRDAEVDAFPICVTAFITDEVKFQTEQFILVNSTKPLPKGLIYELLPNTDALLPGLLHRRRFPAYLLDHLNGDENSPLAKMIQTPTYPEGIINQNSILKMIENSLSDGVLRRYRDADCQLDNAEAMLKVLKAFWGAVQQVFPDAWGLPAKKSRLMHGAGIVSMGMLMDTIADRYRPVGVPTQSQFAEDLGAIKEACRWTDGFWDFGIDGQRKWNTIQNTSNDIQNLSKHLVRLYSAKVWLLNPIKQEISVG